MLFETYFLGKGIKSTFTTISTENCETLYCKPETNVTLHANYIEIKKK